MLVEGSLAIVPELKMCKRVCDRPKNGQKPPNLKMYDFAVWELLRIGRCMLLIFWREEEREKDVLHVRPLSLLVLH